MAEDIIKINSISRLHELLGYEKPKHPLISVIDVSKLKITSEHVNVKVIANLYYISIKSSDCGVMFGRNHCDFEEAVLAFSSPNRVLMAKSEVEFDQEEGWMLFFHPDLIRTSQLGEKIDNYSFFSYDHYEGLHVSDTEKASLRNCIDLVIEEYSQRIDNHSQKVLISTIELLLNLCSRYFDRQFNTRTVQNKQVVGQVQQILKDYYQAGQLTELGPPSITYLAEKVNLSHNYLSDLLKKETGRSAKDHINDFLVNKAKNLLLRTEDSVSEIAYELGFNYPHYFSRLFKNKTGVSPQKYRELNLN